MYVEGLRIVKGEEGEEGEEHCYLGEEGLLPVLAAGLVHGLEAVVLARGLVSVDRAHQD